MSEREHRSGCKLALAIFGSAVPTGFTTVVLNLKRLNETILRSFDLSAYFFL
jgi:hypothetical protein